MLLLAAVTLVGFGRALFWAAVLPVPTEIDEAQHYAYVQSLAEHGHIPVTGRDTVGADDLRIQKENAISTGSSVGVSLDENDPAWAFGKQQYEGFQGPVYYALVVPAYAIARPFGIHAAVYALRLATVLLALTAIPLTYLLARELFPREPAVWLLAPAVLAAVEAFNSNLAQVTNDAVMVPLGAAVLWLVALAWRRFTLPVAVGGGLALGACIAAKGTGAAMLPVAAIGLAGVLVVHRPSLRRAAAWFGAFAAAAAAVVVPWVAYNEHTYGAFSGVKANAAITVPYIGRLRFSGATVRGIVHDVRGSFWVYQGLAHGTVARVWETGLAVAVVAAVVAVLVRRRWTEAAVLGWLVASVPLGFAILLYGLFVQADGGGELLGRHLVVLLPAVAIVMAGGVVMAAGRAAIPLLLGFLTLVTATGVPVAARWLKSTYASPVLPGLAPVPASQSYADGWSPVAAVDVRPPCPVHLVGFTAPGVGSPSGDTHRPVVSLDGLPLTPGGTDGPFALYRLPAPASAGRPLHLALDPAVPIGTSSDERSGIMSLPGATGDPTMRLYCPTGDPEAVRFRTLYRPQHPFPLTYGEARAWPLFGPMAYGAATAVALVLIIGVALDRRRAAPRRTVGRFVPPSGGTVTNSPDVAEVERVSR